MTDLLTALYRTFAPPEAPDEGTSTMRDALAALATHRAAKLAPFLALLERLGFAKWPQGRREWFMRAVGDAPVAQLRSAFAVFKRLSLFAAYATPNEGGTNPLWPRLGYAGPRDDRPAAARSLASPAAPSGVLRADAVVVGSGAGGGVAAALLAQAGLDVIVLEAGPPFEEAAYAQSELRSMSELYLDAGLAANDDASISLLAGACVGGGTTVNWSTSLRLTPRVAAQWETAAEIPGLGAELQASYDAVSARLGVTPAAQHNRNNAVIVDGCAALGWEARAIPRNAACSGEGCGYCGFGCAYGNKQGTALTYLRDAVDAGARVFANAPVSWLRVEDGRATGVEGDGFEVIAPLVVVAAGSLRTPGLLARSGVTSPHLGRHLKLHPTTAVVARFPERVEAWHGPMQSALCDRFADLDDAYGVALEVSPSHPGLSALATPWRARVAHEDDMRDAAHGSSIIVLARDRGEGTVSLDGKDDVHYELAADDAARMLAVVVRAAEMAFAAGATRVSTLHTNPVQLEREEAERDGYARFEREVRKRGAAPNRLAVFSAHQMGTARMAAEPANGVVDEHGAVHGVEGLLVTDASVFPLASGVNPMLTIMALSHRAIAHHVSENVRREPSLST